MWHKKILIQYHDAVTFKQHMSQGWDWVCLFKLVNGKYLVANIIESDCIALCPPSISGQGFLAALFYKGKFAAQATSINTISGFSNQHWGVKHNLGWSVEHNNKSIKFMAPLLQCKFLPINLCSFCLARSPQGDWLIALVFFVCRMLVFCLSVL